jgi:hypothetical protein
MSKLTSHLTKIIFSILTIWCVAVVTLSLFDYHVYFPLQKTEDLYSSIENYRLHAVRASSLSLMALIMIRYLLKKRSFMGLEIVFIFINFLIFFALFYVFKKYIFFNFIDTAELRNAVVLAFCNLVIFFEMRNARN